MVGIVLGLALLVGSSGIRHGCGADRGTFSAACIHRHLYAGACGLCQILVPNVPFGSNFRKGNGSYGGSPFCGEKIILNDRSTEGNPGCYYQLWYFGLRWHFTVCSCVCHLSDCRILISGGRPSEKADPRLHCLRRIYIFHDRISWESPAE